MKINMIAKALKAGKATETVVNGIRMVTIPRWRLGLGAGILTISAMAYGAAQASIALDGYMDGRISDKVVNAMDKIGSIRESRAARRARIASSKDVTFAEKTMSAGLKSKLAYAPTVTMADLEKGDLTKVGAVGVSAYVKAIQDQGLVVEETKALTPEEAKEAGLPVDDINW